MDSNNTISLTDDIRELLDYLWIDERRHYYEESFMGNSPPCNHIFNTMKRIRDEFGLTELFSDEY